MINKNYFTSKLLILFISSLIVISCKENKDKEMILKDIVERNLGSKLHLPKNMNIYKPFKNYKADSTKIMNSNIKVCAFINASCGTCISKINEWEIFANEVSKYNVPIMLICGANNYDRFEFIKYLCESGSVKGFLYPFFLDQKNKYLELNSFMEKEESFKTVLVNNENKILLMGNPIDNKKIKELYLNEIKKISK